MLENSFDGILSMVVLGVFMEAFLPRGDVALLEVVPILTHNHL